ncbi:MAG TPA: acyltransferase [bacterium]|nr:acyltransferase [bacterium]HOL47383.1 acyltransferase [bacterium]HPQ18118.1 acyltransferase [bacterium]
MNYFKHETSVVEEGAKIGSGTKIWHFSHIMKGAEIGNNCILGQNVFVAATAKIGNYVKIQNNVSVYDKVILEDYVFCGPSMVFTNVINPRSAIERKNEYKTTIVKIGASIGANATIICGVTIGKYAFIGAGAVVTKNVPDFAVYFGVPAKFQYWICKCGIKLVAVNNEIYKCPVCSETYILCNNTLRLENE